MPPKVPSSSSAKDGGGFFRSLSSGRYLSSTMCRSLLAYQYDGEDRSFLYRYALQPMNAYLIQFVPIWAAPNLLTMCGLMLMVAAYAATFVYSPNFDKQLPGWLYLACAAALFGYQTIDNLDGRQARRTGSSSPLGLLFDHGVDALNCTFASLLLSAVYSIGQLGPIAIFAFFNIGVIPFIVATWEEYFTGKLTLAEVNGPSDGMFLCMIFCIFGWAVPGIYFSSLGSLAPSIFGGTIAANLPTNTLPLIIGYVGIVFTILGNLFQVSKKVTEWQRPLSKLLPFIAMLVMAWTWVLAQPSFFGAHARVFCFSIGFLFCQMICSLMIAHVCHADYAVRRPVLLPLLAAWINCAVGPIFLPALFPIVDPELVIYALLVWHFSAWFHFIANVILEITELLNIRCFVIVPKDVGHDGATPASATAALNTSPSPSPTSQRAHSPNTTGNGTVLRKKSSAE